MLGEKKREFPERGPRIAGVAKKKRGNPFAWEFGCGENSLRKSASAQNGKEFRRGVGNA